MKIRFTDYLATCVKLKKLGKNNGKQIRLDEPNDEREAWVDLSVQGFEEGYGEDEPEYSTDLIKKVNPHYSEK